MSRTTNLANGLEDVNERTPVEKKHLPDYYLNADGLLKMPLPPLCKGIHDLETIAKAPAVTRYYAGHLATWNTFQSKALEFYGEERTKQELKRCDNAPIYMDPAIEQLNSKAMTLELIQAGAEITLSGRYFWNLLAVVTHIVASLASPEHGQTANPGFFPEGLTFGDSWILEKPYRVGGQQPDIMLKLPTGDENQIRLVGELKFCVGIDFQEMLEMIPEDGGARFRGILGQLFDYMLGHRLKYGFISNYNETIFLQIDLRADGREPCIYYSDIIKHDDVVEASVSSISLRIALFYFMQLTSSPRGQSWKVSNEVYGLTKKWITKASPAPKDLVTPYGDRQPRAVDLAAPHLDLQTPTKIPLFPRSPASSPPGSADEFDISLEALEQHHNQNGVEPSASKIPRPVGIKKNQGSGRRLRSHTADEDT